MNLIKTKIIFCAIAIIIGIFTNEYKKIKEEFEQVLFISGLLILLIPVVIYYIDKWNIPTILKLNENIDPENWFNFIETYITSILTTFISSVFLVWVTAKQINRTYEDNKEINNETMRNQNLPYLQYDFSKEVDDVSDFSKTHLIFPKEKSTKNTKGVPFSIEIKNIGLNAVRKTIIKLESNVFNKLEIIGIDKQTSIDKGETNKEDFLITNIKPGEYNINVTIYYQDLLKNWYEQKIVLNLSVTDINTPESQCIKKFKLYDEKRLTEKPNINIEKNNNGIV